jgi:hypothetical protein
MNGLYKYRNWHFSPFGLKRISKGLKRTNAGPFFMLPLYRAQKMRHERSHF